MHEHHEKEEHYIFLKKCVSILSNSCFVSAAAAAKFWTLLFYIAVLALTCFMPVPGVVVVVAFTAPPSRTTLWSLSSPGGALTPSGGRGGALTTTTTPSPVTASRLAIAMRNNHGRLLNPALSGKKEEDYKKEEDLEKNKWFLQMPTFLDWRCIGSNAGDKLAQGIVQLGDSIVQHGTHIERGITRLGILLALGYVLGNVLAARWTEVGKLLATYSKIVFANKILLALLFAVCLRVAVPILKWVIFDLKSLWSSSSSWGWHKVTRSKKETK
jgi:hypothetical protein